LSKRLIGSQDSPEVGIFWFIQQPGTSPALLGSGVPVEHGEPYREYINYPGDHARYWLEIKPSLAPFFSDGGPKDWPRGRIGYDTTSQRFDVYLNEQLQTPQFEAEIVAYFNLPEARTSFLSDTHYTEARFTLGVQGPHDDGLIAST
jgi:hypothetical protein